MTAREFCYWLQGYFEISRSSGLPDHLNPAQVEIIKNHLAMVFKHEIDPSAGPSAHQSALNLIHGQQNNQGNIVIDRC